MYSLQRIPSVAALLLSVFLVACGSKVDKAIYDQEVKEREMAQTALSHAETKAARFKGQYELEQQSRLAAQNRADTAEQKLKAAGMQIAK